MRLLLTIHVTLTGSFDVDNGTEAVVMLPFTGKAEGEFFTGKTVGSGVDTQRLENGRLKRLSARYMLEGKDYTGAECRIFIENNGPSLDACVPILVTDSKALAYWQKAALVSEVTPTEKGVDVRIFEKD